MLCPSTASCSARTVPRPARRRAAGTPCRRGGSTALSPLCCRAAARVPSLAPSPAASRWWVVCVVCSPQSCQKFAGGGRLPSGGTAVAVTPLTAGSEPQNHRTQQTKHQQDLQIKEAPRRPPQRGALGWLSAQHPAVYMPTLADRKYMNNKRWQAMCRTGASVYCSRQVLRLRRPAAAAACAACIRLSDDGCKASVAARSDFTDTGDA